MFCIHGWKKVGIFKNHPNAAEKPQITRIASNESFELLRADSFGRKWNPFHSLNGMLLITRLHSTFTIYYASTRSFNLIHLPFSVANTSSSKNDSDVLARTPNHRSRCALIDSLRLASSQPLYFFVSLKSQPDRSLNK